MLTFERRLTGNLIPEIPGQMQRPFLVVLIMTTSTGAQGSDYQNGFAIGPGILEVLFRQIWGVISCDVVESDGSVSPGIVWSYGDNGMLRGFSAKNGLEVNNTTDVPPNSHLRMVLFGV